ELPEARQQVAAGLVGIRRKTVEAEAVDEQMRHFPARRLSRHVAVELLIDDLQLLAGERTGVFVARAERAVVEELLAPDVGADQRELAPVDAGLARELLLQRSQRALPGSGCALRVHDDR